MMKKRKTTMADAAKKSGWFVPIFIGAIILAVIIGLIWVGSGGSKKERSSGARSENTHLVSGYTEARVVTLARGETIRFDPPGGSYVCWGVGAGAVRFTYLDAKGARNHVDLASVDKKHIALPTGHRPLKVEGLANGTQFTYRVSFDTPCRDPSRS